MRADQDGWQPLHCACLSARVRELKEWVVELTGWADVLRNALNDVVHIAAQLKADLMNSKKSSDGKVELAKFCDNLIGLNLGGATGQGAGSISCEEEARVLKMSRRNGAARRTMKWEVRLEQRGFGYYIVNQYLE